jgi:mannose-6-phosphate isomerase-like protein (cupin superfamily)
MTVNKIGVVYERPWGTYKTLYLSDNCQVKIITVKPRGRLSLQKHNQRSEHWVVIAGTPTITVGNQSKQMKVNEAVFIPVTVVHRLENLTDKPAVVIEVQLGTYLGEDDIVRLHDVYERE